MKAVGPLKFALFYGILGGLWILLSDRILAFLVRDPQVLTEYQTFKGWAFVVATTILVFFLIKAYTRELEERVAERTAELKKAMERAQEADRVKSAFLATMSHELRTPLNSIIGFTGILLQGMAGPLNPEQEKQLQIVSESSKHLLSLINDILDISKIEAGEFPLSREIFDLREVAERVLRQSAPAAAKKGLELVCRIGPEVKRVESDRRRVEQILLNLVSNSIKFTDKGRITLEGAMVEKDGRSLVKISVTDTGVGIREEDLPKLFQPFQQLDSGSTRKQEGTGLGLAICERLVRLLGGEIWVESKPGVGSRFTFSLPITMG